MLLAEHYLTTIGSRLRLRKKMIGLAPDVAAMFRRYNWPGNVRELRNVIERALILEDSDVITMEYLPTALTGGSVHRASVLSGALAAKVVEEFFPFVSWYLSCFHVGLRRLQPKV